MKQIVLMFDSEYNTKYLSNINRRQLLKHLDNHYTTLMNFIHNMNQRFIQEGVKIDVDKLINKLFFIKQALARHLSLGSKNGERIYEIYLHYESENTQILQFCETLTNKLSLVL